MRGVRRSPAVGVQHVQLLKMLFLCTQSAKQTINDYERNFRSLWNTVEAFGGTLGIHKGLVAEKLMMVGIAVVSSNQTHVKAAEDVAVEQVKVVLLISGADRRK